MSGREVQADASRTWGVNKGTLKRHVDAAKKGTVVRIGPPNVLSDKVIEEAMASQLLNDLRKDSLTKGDAVVAIRNLILQMTF
jgi:hypothetical protein